MMRFALGLAILLAVGCRKSDPTYPYIQQQFQDLGLTDNQDSILSSLPARNFSPSDILLPDGETLYQFLAKTNPSALATWGMSPPPEPDGPVNITGADAKLTFISLLLAEANELTDTLAPFKAAAASDTTMMDNYLDIPGVVNFERPAQTGYAYVFYAGLDLTKRYVAGECPLLLHGLDCSGMVQTMLQNAGMSFARKYSSVELSNETLLDSAILASSYLGNLNYQFIDTGQLSVDKIQSGDIMFFFDNSTGIVDHTGIAIEPTDGSGIYVYQSNGTMLLNPFKGKPCSVYSNDKRRGPRAVPLNGFVSTPDFSRYFVLRLDAPITDSALEGTWKFSTSSTQLYGNGVEIPIPFRYDIVDINNLTVTFNTITNTFTATGNDQSSGAPESYSGNFIYSRQSNQIIFHGVQIFGYDPMPAVITNLTNQTLTLAFAIPTKGGMQDTQITFVKQ